MILYQTQPRPITAVGPSEEIAQFHPRFDPLQKFTMFVFLVTRCIKLLSSEGADIIYRDALSECDAEMQSSFNNIGSLALTPKIRSGSPSLLEIDSS